MTTLVENLILATDMSRHGSFMSILRNEVDACTSPAGISQDESAAAATAMARLRAAGDAGEEAASRRRLYGELLMKCADTSNVLKPFPIATRWAVRDPLFAQLREA